MIYLSIFFVHLLALLSPGPDVLLVTHLAISHGRIKAILASFGIMAGIAVWVFISLIGFQFIFSIFPFLIKFFLLIGSIYLFYIGICLLISSYKCFYKKENGEYKKQMKIVDGNPFTAGFFNIVLFNPKAIIYFSSIFTLFLEDLYSFHSRIIVFFIIVIESGLFFIVVSFLFSTEKIRSLYQERVVYIDFATGLLFIILAVCLIFK